VLIIGTSDGVFVAEPGQAATSTPLAQDVKVLRQANGYLLAGTSDGVYRSTDQGRAWQRVGLEQRQVLEVAPAPDDSQLIYAGTVPAALFRSRDGGESWTEVTSFSQAWSPDTWGLPDIPGWPSGARAHSIVVDSSTPPRCWVGIEVGGVIASEDGGASWSTVLPGGDPDIHVIVADPSNPQRLYCSTGYGRIGKLAEQPQEERIAGMFGSDDGGRTWRHLWASMGRQYTRPLCIDPRPPHALTVGSTPSAAPYINYRMPGGATGYVYQSTDGGTTWRSIGDAEHAPSVAAPLCVVPAGDAAGNVLVGTDLGEVWHVAADTARWTLLAGGLPPVQSVVSLSG
jgi:photosystem II stability/assembly factor-like uncharacterized protein